MYVSNLNPVLVLANILLHILCFVRLVLNFDYRALVSPKNLGLLALFSGAQKIILLILQQNVDKK